MIPSKLATRATIGASVALALPSVLSSSSHEASVPICEGWVLKKRRKKMQGFARRYFILYPSGLLSYSFEPGQPVRDQISLHHAAISTAPGRKDIHVDSNTATFHIKCLSTEDFNKWMSAFRKFIFVASEARQSASMRLVSRHGSATINKAGVIAEEISVTIGLLEDSITTMAQDLTLQSAKQNSMSKKEKLKDHSKDSKFGLFKRSSNHSSAQEFGLDSNGAENASAGQLPSSAERALSALHTLKVQHASLLKAVQGSNAPESNRSSAHGSPLPFTVEEEEQSDQILPYLTPALSRQSKHASLTTMASDSVHEWFDALDGAEEFVMDVQSTPDGPEQPSQMLTNESRSSLGQQETSSLNTDATTDIPCHGESQIIRRTQLPAPPIADEGSLFAILKSNVGKDLSTIQFPVTFNEPLTLLQRAAEELEYYDIINQAAQTDDPVDRFCLVAAFAVSSYAHTRHRSGRKGFNPMLCETFEDSRMKFIAEKVRHQPLEMAYHAEGENWELNATSSGRTKFWGKSLEIIPLGVTRLRVGDDTYIWKKPSSFMRNLMVGTKYLEHSGKMILENSRDHARCILEFKQNGYWGSSNEVSGTVFGPSGETLCHLEGKWDDQMAQKLDSSHFRVLWRMTPFPKNCHEYYGFTTFGITLNELTSGIACKLPPTDSRYRPDVRALENGELDIAEAEKSRVEEMQRTRRRQGEDRQPRWFRQVGDDWVYVGGYWETRACGWKEEIHPLW